MLRSSNCSTPVLLLALGAWTLFGSMVLSYWPNTRGWWTPNWVPIVMARVGSLFDNHPVTALPRGDTGDPADWRLARAPLPEHFTQWMPVLPEALDGGFRYRCDP